MSDLMKVHATCIALNGQGVLLQGTSGSGKSDLALCLINNGALLISDDQVVLKRCGQQVLASAPEGFSGLLEVRGIGICSFDYLSECPLKLIVTLQSEQIIERMPDLHNSYQDLLGVEIPHFVLNPFEASAVAKIKAGLQLVYRTVSDSQ